MVIRGGALKRVVAPQGVFFQSKDGWQRATVHAAKLQGGQLSAVRPPTEDERREAAKSKGRLGVGVEGLAAPFAENDVNALRLDPGRRPEPCPLAAHRRLAVLVDKGADDHLQIEGRP